MIESLLPGFQTLISQLHLTPTILQDGKAFGAEGAGNHASFPAKAQPAVTEGGASEELPLIILSQPLFPGEVAELRGSDLREAEQKIKSKAEGGQGGRFLVGYAPKGKVAQVCCIAEIQEPSSSSSSDAIEPPLKIIGISRAKVRSLACSLPHFPSFTFDHLSFLNPSFPLLPPASTFKLVHHCRPGPFHAYLERNQTPPRSSPQSSPRQWEWRHPSPTKEATKRTTKHTLSSRPFPSLPASAS